MTNKGGVGMRLERTRTPAEERFAFGENWQQFLDVLDDARVRAAEDALAEWLGRDLSGLSFLDVGSGSGLSSLAARNLGARVVSFDYDQRSVDCTMQVRSAYRPDDENWRVEHGSALDSDYLAGLGAFDIVYSWGVLHHTGALWAAVDEVRRCCAANGRLFIALYNDQGRLSTAWTMVKRSYVHAGPNGKRAILATVGNALTVGGAVVDRIRGRRSPRRGMDRRRDVVDWVGGWPFEVSAPADVVSFLEERGFEPSRVQSVGRRMGNNEYLFRAPATARARQGTQSRPQPPRDVEAW